MKGKNEENWEKDIKKSIDEGRIRAKRKNEEKLKKNFFLKMSVCPAGTEAANSPCPATIKRATGTRARSKRSPVHTTNKVYRQTGRQNNRKLLPLLSQRDLMQRLL